MITFPFEFDRNLIATKKCETFEFFGEEIPVFCNLSPVNLKSKIFTYRPACIIDNIIMPPELRLGEEVKPALDERASDEDFIGDFYFVCEPILDLHNVVPEHDSHRIISLYRNPTLGGTPARCFTYTEYKFDRKNFTKWRTSASTFATSSFSSIVPDKYTNVIKSGSIDNTLNFPLSECPEPTIGSFQLLKDKK